MTMLSFWLAAPAAAMRAALGLLFLQAALGKIRHLQEFAAIVLNYRLLPQVLARPAASLLVFSEIVVAAALLSGFPRSWAGFAAAALLALFTGAMAINLLRGRTDISCGCRPAAAERATLSWRGVLATGLLVPPAFLAGLGGAVTEKATLFQSALAGLLLFTLHDTATRLANTRRAGARA